MALSILRFFQINRNAFNRICAVRYLSTSNDGDGIPEPPKKPLSTFLQFFLTNKNEIQSQNPGKKYVEVAKIASKMWSELDQKKKQEYQMDYEEKKLKFNKDYHDFLSNLTEAQKKQFEENITQRREKRQKNRAHRKYIKRTVELGKPKKSPSGYTLFAADFIKKNKTEGLRIIETMREAGRSWKQLPEEEKEKYNKEAVVLRDQYQENMSHWVQQMVLDGYYDILQRNEIKQELVNLGQPKKPPNAFGLFAAEHKTEMVGQSLKEFQPELSDRWKKLPKDERQNFKEEYLSKLQSFKQAVEDWEIQMEEDGMLEFVKAARKLLRPKRRLATVVKPKKIATKKTTKTKKTTGVKKTTKSNKDKKEETDKTKTGKTTSKTKETKDKKAEKTTKTEKLSEWYEE